jgi:hypothetical protein
MREFLAQSSNHHVVHIKQTAHFFRGFVLIRENVPEPERFISGSSNYCTSIGTHGEVQHSVGMSCQGCNLLHFGILPYVDLVLGISVSTDQFVQTFAENQVTNLRANVHGFYCCSIQSVSETDCSVSCSSA